MQSFNPDVLTVHGRWGAIATATDLARTGWQILAVETLRGFTGWPFIICYDSIER